VLLTLARLIDRKGQDTVIRALPRVLRDVPDLVYVLAGQGSYREALEALARECGVADHVVFAGFVADADVPDVYAAADLYGMLSREGRDTGDIEGFGITYLEASAAGLPVLAGRSGGTADAVEEGVSGLLVDPESVEAVADAIVSLLRDRAKARAMGQAGRLRAERDFSLAARAAKLIRVASAL
jgi:phosphatidylinositol alpha-1,6-mannosyltransferase